MSESDNGVRDTKIAANHRASHSIVVCELTMSASRLGLPQRRDRAVPLPCNAAVDDIGLELAADERSTIAAHAHQANAALRQAFDRGHANLLGEAADHHDSFVECEMDDAAHFAASRFAAASASRAWVYR